MKDGALAQLGERLLCTQEVSGSIPLSSTIGGVAQLARADGSYPSGRGFDPLRRHQFGSVAQLVRATGS
jgi:hypothetical protein